MEKQEIIAYTKTVSLVLISLLFLILPVFFLTNTTDFFTLPKQLLVVFTTVVILLLWGVRMFFEKRVILRVSPFTLPLILFGIIVLLSALLSKNMYDSLLSAVPIVAVVLLFFAVINTISDRNSLSMALTSLVLGGVIAAVVSVFYYLKIYFLPFPAIQSQFFNTFGSAIQLLAYLIVLLIVAGFSLSQARKRKQIDSNIVFQGASALIVLAGIILLVAQIAVSPQKPAFLPYSHGFQIALASISQDVGRGIQAFLLGSGFGTFVTDFTRFRLPTFNQNQTLWNFTFTSSSSFVLELLSTSGILGFLAFLFLAIQVLRTRLATLNPLFVGLLVVLGMSLFIPFSFSLIFLLFMLLALYTAFLFLERDRRVYDITVRMVALQEGLFEITEGAASTRKRDLAFLPIVFLIIVVIVGGATTFFGIKLLLSDMAFATSLSKEALSSGQKTYNLEQQAIRDFQYRSDYYRVFSQINVALANNLLAAIPQGGSPSAQTQQTALTLLQQGVTSARAAVQLSPLSSANWVNLGQIYRGLINVGQNAEQFAIGSLRQAIALDPSNPQLYVELGGIYYQLQAYDLAQNQFQIAVNLKPDYANAYYNLGHALEAKGDLQQALQAYRIVRQLVKDNNENAKKIDEEIAALEKKIGSATSTTQTTPTTQTTSKEPLKVNAPNTQLPPQKQQVKIPPPPITPTPSGEAAPTPSPKP